MIWLSESTIERPNEIGRAYTDSRRHTRINRYRSRTEVSDDTIITAFLWQYLPYLNGEDLVNPPQSNWHYMTKAVRRGISVEEALAEARQAISNLLANSYMSKKMLVFNTATAAAASESIKNMLDTDQSYHELDIRTMLTSTPNHRIHVYKQVDEEGHILYIVLNNLDTPGVIYKLGAAIMYTENHFGDATTGWAEAWMSGNPDVIYAHASAYYKEYNEHKQERELKAALDTMIANLSNVKKQQFEKRINDLQASIDSYYIDIARMTKDLNQIKANYLFQVTMDEDQHMKDLQEYLNSCKDKLSYIKAENNSLSIVYKTELIYFEEELLKPYFNSHRSNVIKDAAPWKQQLIKDLFIEKKYSLLIESSIMINFAERSFRYIPVNHYIPDGSMQGIPNPHHMFYNCWGDNQPNMHRALQNGDYLQTILIAFAAMSGLNLSDTAVIDKFVREEMVMYNTVPCLKNKETGDVISVADYERRYNNAPDEILE